MKLGRVVHFDPTNGSGLVANEGSEFTFCHKDGQRPVVFSGKVQLEPQNGKRLQEPRPGDLILYRRDGGKVTWVYDWELKKAQSEAQGRQIPAARQGKPDQTGNVYRLFLITIDHHTGKTTEKKAWEGYNPRNLSLRHILEEEFRATKQLPNGRVLKMRKRFEVKLGGKGPWTRCPDPTTARS